MDYTSHVTCIAASGMSDAEALESSAVWEGNATLYGEAGESAANVLGRAWDYAVYTDAG